MRADGQNERGISGSASRRIRRWLGAEFDGAEVPGQVGDRANNAANHVLTRNHVLAANANIYRDRHT